MFGGIVLFSIVIGMNGITMMQLIKTAENYHGVQSYSDLGLRVLGPRGKSVIDLCIIVKQICTCISYLFFVSKQLDFIVCQSSGRCLGNHPYCLMLVIPVIIMSSANSYKFLSYLSIPSIMIAILGMFCVLFYSFSELTQGNTSHSDLRYFDLQSIIGRIGLAMYIFDGNAIVVNIRAEAREKKHHYPSILKNAILFTLSLFVTFSTITYYVYREQAQPIFTMSLVPLNSLIVFILCCVCINALTSYPVQMLAAFKIIENSEYFAHPARESRMRGFLRKIGIRASVIVLTTIICLSVQTFTDYINIAGAIGSVTVAFVIPEMLYLKSFGERVTPLKRAGCYFIAAFGIVGSTYSIYYSIKKLAMGDLS